MAKQSKPPLAAFLSLSLLVLTSLAFAPGRADAQGGPPTFLVLGDSIGFGIGATEPETGGYAALTYGALRESQRYRETGLNFINLSVPGATSADLLEPGGQLEVGVSEINDRAANDGAVEIIAVDIGGNDLLDLGQRDSPCLTDTSGAQCLDELRLALSELQVNLGEILLALRTAAPEAILVVVDLYNPYSGTDSGLEIIANAAVQQFNGVISVAAVDPFLAVRMAPLYQVFDGRGNQWVASDGIHPNDSGHAVVAEVVLAAIDGREPQIPEELLNVPTAGPDGEDPVPVTDPADNGGVDTWVLVVAVAASFAIGAAVSATYFIARGRA